MILTTKKLKVAAPTGGVTAVRATLWRWLEALQIALDSIRANRLRSALTVVGIVIGVAVVILIAALLEGAQNLVIKVTADFAPDVIRIEKASFQDFGGDGQAFIEARAKRPDIVPDDARFLRQQLGNTYEVGAQGDASLPVRRENKTLLGIVIQGVTPNIMQLTSVRVERGREFTNVDEERRRPVCIIGADVADKLFADADPLGREIRIGQLPYQVVGIAAPRGSLFGQSQDGFVMIPLGTFAKIFGERNRSFAILGRARPETNLTVNDTEEALRGAMRLRHRLKNGVDEDDFSMVTAKSIQAFTANITGIVGAALYPLTLVALAVGGVVVMNMMLASVTERTREIGVRLAIGARRDDILIQFLIEATFLTLMGGLLGVALSVGMIQVVGAATTLPINVPFWAVGFALAVSCTVGLLFGIVPARRAAKLDPVAALRAE